MTKKQLLTTLDKQPKENDFYFNGDNHTIGQSELHDIVDMIKDEKKDYKDYYDIVEELQYDGIITEYADSATPIYYYNIAKWFGEHWTAVNDYIDEFGELATDGQGKSDIMKTIQGAYCMTYERDLQSALEVLFKEAEEDNE